MKCKLIILLLCSFSLYAKVVTIKNAVNAIVITVNSNVFKGLLLDTNKDEIRIKLNEVVVFVDEIKYKKELSITGMMRVVLDDGQIFTGKIREDREGNTIIAGSIFSGKRIKSKNDVKRFTIITNDDITIVGDLVSETSEYIRLNRIDNPQGQYIDIKKIRKINRNTRKINVKEAQKEHDSWLLVKTFNSTKVDVFYSPGVFINKELRDIIPAIHFLGVGFNQGLDNFFNIWREREWYVPGIRIEGRVGYAKYRDDELYYLGGLVGLIWSNRFTKSGIFYFGLLGGINYFQFKYSNNIIEGYNIPIEVYFEYEYQFLRMWSVFAQLRGAVFIEEDNFFFFSYFILGGRYAI